MSQEESVGSQGVVGSEYDQGALIALIREHALRFGDFTLASGQKASFYLDCRKVTLHGRGARLIGYGMLDRLASFGVVDAVGGLAIGADPITGAVITCAAHRGQDLLGFIVRKEQKQHGTGQLVEGPVSPGQRCVVVEDVVTTAGSSLVAIERAREFGLEVLGVLALVDRLQGGAERLAEVGVPLQSLLTIRDLGI